MGERADDDALLAVLGDAADAAMAAVDASGDFRLTGAAHEQHAADVAADAAAVEVLAGAGLAVVSEESGRCGDGELTVVLDPLDGSTNAAQGLPWRATSLCAMDGDGARAALVVDHTSGERFQAVRGGGATGNGTPLAPSTVERLADAVVNLTDLPPHHLGWRQFRAYGAIALDLCAVAAGRFDAVIDCGRSAHGPWDYLAGALICREAGAAIADALGRPLDVSDPAARRTVLAAGTGPLLDEVRTARATFPA